MFGYGTGNTGQNSAIATPGLTIPYNLALPGERPFRSLSYPDINFTIMRPAALPPSTVSNPAMVPNSNSATNAGALYVTQTAAALATTLPLPYTPPPYFSPSGVGNPLVGPSFYSPLIYDTNQTNFAQNTPIVYTGDPGVRNPFFNQGYVTSAPTVNTMPYTLYTPAGRRSSPARRALTCRPASRCRRTSPSRPESRPHPS